MRFLIAVLVLVSVMSVAGCGSVHRVCHTDRTIVSLDNSSGQITIRVNDDTNSYTIHDADFNGEGLHTQVGDHVALCADVDQFATTDVVSFHNFKLEVTPTVVPVTATPTK